MPIFSGKESEKLWDAINIAFDDRDYHKKRVFEALYLLGCKCQELEAEVEKLRAMGKEGYVVVPEAALTRSVLKRIRDMQKTGDNKTVATKAKSFKTKTVTAPATKIVKSTGGKVVVKRGNKVIGAQG